MIPQTQAHVTEDNWQSLLSHAINDPKILLEQLGLADKLALVNDTVLKQFPLRVPQSYIDKMQYGDPHDPLLRQVFPLIDEQFDVEGFITDPVGDQLASRLPGVLQKYHGRTLLVTTGACAIHCRYCFRRHFPYSESNPLAGKWQQTLKELNDDLSINEVILSGGDPLVLSDLKLSNMIKDLEKISHIKRLRIHTRLPIVLPERIDTHLLQWLKATKLQVIMVIHANHANEIDSVVADKLHDLHHAGCQLLNQSVLLKGVNDQVQDLVNLSERLSDLRVIPYYLHLLDKVKGASHFDVAEQRAIQLMAQLRTQLPGYLVPRLVREQQGEPSKTVIA